ncbi:uncharacterized protein E5676_scaffold13G004050 [Cucumis melo var. makuwa]|uniref:Uncharacterized protein n=1 Tax=Cucumis melo var. makuwa TaxID=1194695 RepID=A0A5D3C5I9_CUCMM|nr:uncharacterized protein E5676_scaffold13G004050 [Cucumis melo var. makuwa]
MPLRRLLLTPTLSTVKTILLLLSAAFIVYTLFFNSSFHSPSLLCSRSTLSPTTRRHIVFAIASSSNSWSRRKPYVRLWYNRNSTRAFAFVDRIAPDFASADPSVPPVIVSNDTSRFPYTFRGGLRSAIRVARVVKEIVERNEQDVRWYVFGDDDTLFFVDNLVKTLGKYDHERWYYIGSNSESYGQNLKNSFDMAFGGGGFAISHSLARVLAGVLDSCLTRYGHLYGSDARIWSCLVELGVGLTHEPGFHQVDMRGNLFGLLSAHALSPIISLHHLDAMDPIFPNMNNTQALHHLFEAVNVDPGRIFQQIVCYDRSHSLTISVSWGFAIQVFEGNRLLPDLLSLQRTFMSWRRAATIDANQYLFNIREYPKDPCKRNIFYMQNLRTSKNNALTNYTRKMVTDCPASGAIKNLTQIRVFSQKLELDVEEMKAPRRQCCDIISSSKESMLLEIRQCGVEELISMREKKVAMLSSLIRGVLERKQNGFEFLLAF